MTTPLKIAREKRDVSVPEICKAIGTHPQNYYRIERGDQPPKRELARRIHEYFEGDVSMGEIYDPEFVAGEVSAA